MNELLAFEYIIDPNKRIFWLYIISSIAIALFYLQINKKQYRINLSKKLWLHPSSLLDYKYFFISYFIKVFMIFPIVISAREVSLFTYEFLSENYDFIDVNLSYESVIFLYTISLFVVSDFTRYWLHRFLHTIPLLWRFHKVHHSAKVLNPLTFYRVHPVENILFGFRYSLTIGVVTGVFIYLFGAMLDIYTILGANIFLVVFSFMGSNLRHSHIHLSYFKFLENIFISPKQHQIHHSKKYFNKNYGGYLAIWDKLFGSLMLSNEVKILKFGLKNEQMKSYKNILDLLFKPFLIDKKGTLE